MVRKLSLEDGWETRGVKETQFVLSHTSHIHGTKVPNQKRLSFLTMSLSCSRVAREGCMT